MVRPPSSSQIPLDLAPRAEFTFARFLTSKDNAALVEHLKIPEQWPAPILLLIGEEGVGKTHLGTAFAAEGQRYDFIDEAHEVDEAQLFKMMNRALTGECDALLLAAPTPPTSWNTRLPDLRSRLKNTPTMQISAPDDSVLEGITRQLFQGFGRDVSRDVVLYIVSRTARTVPALQTIVQNLETQAQSDKADVTKAYAARHMTRWDEPDLF